ncbi:MAG: glycosyltransferase family 4 protein [Bacteroidota bacterium]
MNDSHFILGFLTSFLVVILATPALIKVAKMKHLVDEPGEERKLHQRSVPTIGGIIIFSGILFAYSLWFPDAGVNLHQAIREFKYLTASLIILFFIGVKDDIIGTAPVKKLLAHIVVAFILVMMGDIKITSMHGLFGVEELPDWGSVLLSVFVYIVIVNAFNLIDGVDGLASGVGVIAGLSFGAWFYFCENYPLALLSFTLSGALIGFLIFNFSPAKIFMGDSGSLTIGCIISVLAIRMIETPVKQIPAELKEVAVPVIVMAVLVYPLLDTLRVFFVRTVKGQSPFSADKNHLHHRLIKIGNSHAKTVLWIYFGNMMVVTAAFFTSPFGPTVCFILSLLSAAALAAIPFAFKVKEE